MDKHVKLVKHSLLAHLSYVELHSEDLMKAEAKLLKVLDKHRILIDSYLVINFTGDVVKMISACTWQEISSVDFLVTKFSTFLLDNYNQTIDPNQLEKLITELEEQFEYYRRTRVMTRKDLK